jgi:hypothetical protein
MTFCEPGTTTLAQDMLEVLESFPEGKEFETPADVVRACGQADQLPQTGIIDVKP